MRKASRWVIIVGVLACAGMVLWFGPGLFTRDHPNSPATTQAVDQATTQSPTSFVPPERDKKLIADLKAIGLSPVFDPVPDCIYMHWSRGGTTFGVSSETPLGHVLTLNGKPYGPYPSIADEPGLIRFSGDGSTCAMVIQKDRNDYHTQTLVVNGREVASGDAFPIVALSDEGKRLAYVKSLPMSRNELFIDGKSVGEYSYVGSVAFSPDGKKAIWTAAEKPPMSFGGAGGFDVFVDGKRFSAGFQWAGKERMDPAAIDPILISPDSARWAVCGQVVGGDTSAAGGVGGYAVMLDGKMQPTFPDVRAESMRFSADSKDFFYVAGQAEKGHYSVYRDGQPGKEWKYIRADSLQLIDGGKRVSYVASVGGDGNFSASLEAKTWGIGMPALVVGDETALPTCEEYAITADGKHVLGHVVPQNLNDPKQISALLYDKKKITDLHSDARILQLGFSPDDSHWFAVVGGLGPPPAVYIDGEKRSLPGDSDVRWASIDNAGRLSLAVFINGQAWKLVSAPAAKR